MSVYERVADTGVAKAGSAVVGDDDWDTDPDYVNDIGEKNTRKGSKLIVAPTADQLGGGIQEIHRRALEQHDTIASTEHAQKKTLYGGK